MDAVDRIGTIPDFWTRQFAYYLNEHRHRGNRATHMLGIPLLIATAIVGLVYVASGQWQVGLAWIVGGQLVGWAIQLVGHRIEGNKPALLKRPISFLMGPLMVLVEMLEYVGVHFAFAARARQAISGGALDFAEAHQR